MLNANYFAGLVDSDFGVHIHEFYPRGRCQLRPTISLGNINFRLIEEVSHHLKLHDVSHHVAFRPATKGRDSKEITIKRLEKCLLFSNLWSKGCVVRRKQLELLSKFCASRINLMHDFGWKQNNTPYTPEEIAIKDNIRSLNDNYNYDFGHRNQTMSWLAGFIDGDGSICFIETKSGRVIPALDITTESDSAKENVLQLYSKYSITPEVRVSIGKESKKTKKNLYNIYIRSFSDLNTVLTGLKEHLIVKEEQCSLMLKYLSSRSSSKFYTAGEREIVDRVKFLNTEMRYPRDYMCDTFKGEDIVQSL